MQKGAWSSKETWPFPELSERMVMSVFSFHSVQFSLIKKKENHCQGGLCEGDPGIVMDTCDPSTGKADARR